MCLPVKLLTLSITIPRLFTLRTPPRRSPAVALVTAIPRQLAHILGVLSHRRTCRFLAEGSSGQRLVLCGFDDYAHGGDDEVPCDGVLEGARAWGDEDIVSVFLWHFFLLLLLLLLPLGLVRFGQGG